MSRAHSRDDTTNPRRTISSSEIRRPPISFGAAKTTALAQSSAGPFKTFLFVTPARKPRRLVLRFLASTGDARFTRLRAAGGDAPHWSRDAPVVAILTGIGGCSVATMESLVSRSVAARRRLRRSRRSGARVRAAREIGAYAMVACVAAERVREIGVRLALGASPGRVFRLILGEAILTAATGCAAGTLAALLAARALEAQLFGVRAIDGWVLITMVAIALMASRRGRVITRRRAAAAESAAGVRSE